MTTALDLENQIFDELETLAGAASTPAPAELRFRAQKIVRLLAPSFRRHEKGVAFAVRVATDRERLVYWIGRVYKDPTLWPKLFEALGKMGYTTGHIDHVVSLGEPREALE